MKKQWVVQDGIIGTAHQSRTGRMVDFRPATVVWQDGQIVIRPPKRQMLDPIQLAPSRKETITEREDCPRKGQRQVKEILYAVYMGLEISVASPVRSEWYDTEAKIEYDRWLEEVKKQSEDQEKAWLVFAKSLTYEELARGVTAREVGRLRSGRAQPDGVLYRVLTTMLEEEFGMGSFYDTVTAISLDPEVFKQTVLAFDDQRRADRKASFSATQSEA